MKPAALLIPGLDGTGLLYYRQIAPLEKRYRVMAWRFHPGDAFDYPDLVGELAQATRDETPGSMVVAGESFGGTIALHYALSFPDRVGCLALINTFPVYNRRFLIHLACGFAPMLRWRGIHALKNYVVDRTLALEGVSSEDRRQYRELIRQVHQPAYCRRLQMVRDVDLRDKLECVSAPTLLFASGRDKLVPAVEQARYMSARIPDARLYEFPQAGHALLLTPGFVLADYLR